MLPTGNEININGYVAKYNFDQKREKFFATDQPDQYSEFGVSNTYLLSVCINLGGSTLTLDYTKEIREIRRYQLESYTDFDLSDNIDWAALGKNEEQVTQMFDDIIDYINIETLEQL